MTSLINCIKSIPSKLCNIYTNKNITFKDVKGYLDNVKNIEKIIFVCSGSSYNAILSSKNFLENICGIKVDIVYSNIFLNYTNLINKDDMYIFVSQGGFTKAIYDSIKKAKANNCNTMVVTADCSSPIAKESDISIDIMCGYEPFLYRTMGFSTTVATICLLGIEVALYNKAMSLEEANMIYDDYKYCYGNLDTINTQTIKWYKKNKFEILKRNKILLTGTNDLLGIAMEADIKFMEMIPLLTRSFELEEFIHGPQNVFDDSFIYFILSKPNEDVERVTSIAKFLKEEIGICYVVGSNTLTNKK